jgi:hypothetical protein
MDAVKLYKQVATEIIIQCLKKGRGWSLIQANRHCKRGKLIADQTSRKCEEEPQERITLIRDMNKYDRSDMEL